MAKTGRLSFEKRQRELKKKEKRKEKLERRNIRKEIKKNDEQASGTPDEQESADSESPPIDP